MLFSCFTGSKYFWDGTIETPVWNHISLYCIDDASFSLPKLVNVVIQANKEAFNC